MNGEEDQVEQVKQSMGDMPQVPEPFFRGLKYNKAKLPKDLFGDYKYNEQTDREIPVVPVMKVFKPKQVMSMMDVGPQAGTPVEVKVGDVSMITKRGKYGKKGRKSAPKKEKVTGKFYGL